MMKDEIEFSTYIFFFFLHFKFRIVFLVSFFTIVFRLLFIKN